MITQELKDLYGISDSGKILSELILSYMFSESSTNMEDDSADSIINSSETVRTIYDCFSDKIHDRGDAYKYNLCIQNGIIDYMTNYSSIELKSNGVANVSPGQPPVIVPPATTPELRPPIVVDDDYDLGHIGKLHLNDKFTPLFTMFSLGRLMGLHDDDDTDYVAELFEDILQWITFNLLPVPLDKVSYLLPNGESRNSVYITSSGFEKETIMNGYGSIYFNATEEEITGMVNDISTKLVKLNDANLANLKSEGIPMAWYFSSVWGIISTGIEEFLNINKVVTDDYGFSFYTDTLYTYGGASEGSAIFGDKYMQYIDILVFSVPIFNIDFYITATVPISDMNVITEIKDHLGVKPLVFPIFFEKIGLILSSIQDGIDMVIEAIEDAIEFIFKEISDKLDRLGKNFEEIIEVLAQALEAIKNFIIELFEGIMFIIEWVMQKLAKFLKTIVVRSKRRFDIIWSTLRNNAVVVIAEASELLYQAIELANKIQAEIEEAIMKGINKIKEIANLISLKNLIIYFADIINDINDIIDILNSIGHGFCFIPEIPTIPSIPEIPETPLDVNPEDFGESILPPEPDLTDMSDEDLELIGAEPSFPKVVSAIVEYDEDGNLINESPDVLALVNGIVNPMISGITPSFEVDVDDIIGTPLPIPTTEELSLLYPPELSQDVSDPSLYKNVKEFRTSLKMKNHIKSYETYTSRIYQDPDKKHASIGYGHVVGLWSNRASLQQTIDKTGAESFFESDIAIAEGAVKTYVRQLITQGQFDSFVDLVYNAGMGTFRKSTTLATFNAGNICLCGWWYQRAFITANGEILKGLVRRRASGFLFYSDKWGLNC